MGERGNIKFTYEDGSSIYFYDHWDGDVLAKSVQKSLHRGRSRWNDESYLARIVFCDLIQGVEQELTGVGISPYESPGNYMTIEINVGKQLVYFLDGTLNRNWTFVQYVNEDVEELTEMYLGLK